MSDPNILTPAQVSTDRFTYDGATNTFIADASDLPPFGRVYADACDVGLTLVSAKSGCSVVFAVSREERDGEGELLYTELRAASGEWRYGTVRVFND